MMRQDASPTVEGDTNWQGREWRGLRNAAFKGNAYQN